MSETTPETTPETPAAAYGAEPNPRAVYVAALRVERESLARLADEDATRHDAARRLAEIDDQLAEFGEAPGRRGAPRKAVRQ